MLKQNNLNDTKLTCSIIILIYNGEKFLRETLETIKIQGMSNLELIFIDDKSSDSSFSIINEWLEENHHEINSFRIVSHLKNQGVSISILDGLSYAQSEFVMVMSQDDLLPRNHIRTMARLLDKEKECVAVSPSASIFTSNKNSFFNPKSLVQTKFQSGVYLFISLLATNCFIAPGSIYRKSAIQPSYLSPGNLLAQDWELWINLSLNGTILTSKSAIKYRVHENSLHLSRNNLELAVDIQLMLQRIFNSKPFLEVLKYEISQFSHKQIFGLECAILQLLHLSPNSFTVIDQAFRSLEPNINFKEIESIIGSSNIEIGKKVTFFADQKAEIDIDSRNLLIASIKNWESRFTNPKTVSTRSLLKSVNLNLMSKILLLLSVIASKFCSILPEFLSTYTYSRTVQIIMRKFRDSMFLL